MRRAKEISVVILVLLGLVAVAWGIDAVYTANKAGSIVQPGQAHTAQSAWAIVDATTSDGKEPNDLLVDERTYAAVVAAVAAAASTTDGDIEISVYAIPTWINAGRFRSGGVVDNDTATYQIYLGTLGPGGTDCDLANAGQLVFTMGTQESSIADCNLADAVTVTPYCWPKSWGYATNADADLVAEATLDLMGADILVAVPTETSTDCWLFMKGF